MTKLQARSFNWIPWIEWIWFAFSSYLRKGILFGSARISSEKRDGATGHWKEPPPTPPKLWPLLKQATEQPVGETKGSLNNISFVKSRWAPAFCPPLRRFAAQWRARCCSAALLLRQADAPPGVLAPCHRRRDPFSFPSHVRRMDGVLS